MTDKTVSVPQPRLMRLPKNSHYPNYSETHPEDDWCAKVGCTPACVSVPTESRSTQDQYRANAKNVLKAFYASGGIELPDSDLEREEHLAELEIVEFALQSASSSLLPIGKATKKK